MPQFVFLASCYSEFVGRVFLEAGVEHVICIDKRYEVSDDTIAKFVRAFYHGLFS